MTRYDHFPINVFFCFTARSSSSIYCRNSRDYTQLINECLRVVLKKFNVRKHAAARFFSRLEVTTVRLLEFQAVPDAVHRGSALLGALALPRPAYRLPIAVVLQGCA